MTTTRTVTLDPAGSLRCPERDTRLDPPEGWTLLPSGDAALTRRVKAAGAHWVVEERRGRKRFTRGVYAPEARIAELREALERERARPEYAQRLAAGRARRARAQEDYVLEFREAVEGFLGFAPRYRELGRRLAQEVASHATPVGSGTVARTQRIPVERRAAAAVIAWLRHQTTDYDRMAIPQVKGERRAVRRRLAKRARALLEAFRRGEDVDRESCPLHRALEHEGAPAAAPADPRPPKLLGLGAAPRTRPVRAANPPRSEPSARPKLWERGLGR